MLLRLLVGLALLVTLLIAFARARAFMRARLVARLAPPGRAMGMLEHAFDVMHHMGAFIIVQVVRLRGELREETLRRALDAVQARHPLLRVHVEGPDGLFRAPGTKAIPLRVVEWDSDERVRVAAEQELLRPIPFGNDPLVRLTFVRGGAAAGWRGALIVAANHAVYDGASAITFIRDLLTACAEGAPLQLAQNATEVPPMDAGLAGKVFPPGPRDPKAALLPPARAAKVQERAMRVDFARLDAATLSLILARCKAKQTTFHGALAAASLFAIGREFGVDRELSLSSNINVRKELSPEVAPDVIGCFISGVTTGHTIARGDDLWATAKHVREAVERPMAEQRHLRVLQGDFTWLHELGLRHLLPQANDGRLNVLNVTNSGRFELPRTYGGIELLELYAVSSQHVLGSTLQVGAMTLSGELFLSFSWCVPLVTDEMAGRMKQSLLSLLSAIAQGDEPILAGA